MLSLWHMIPRKRRTLEGEPPACLCIIRESANIFRIYKSAYVSVYIFKNVIASNSNKRMPNRQFDPTCSLNIATSLSAQFAQKEEVIKQLLSYCRATVILQCPTCLSIETNSQLESH